MRAVYFLELLRFLVLALNILVTQDESACAIAAPEVDKSHISQFGASSRALCLISEHEYGPQGGHCQDAHYFRFSASLLDNKLSPLDCFTKMMFIMLKVLWFPAHVEYPLNEPAIQEHSQRIQKEEFQAKFRIKGLFFKDIYPDLPIIKPETPRSFTDWEAKPTSNKSLLEQSFS